jgi:glycosyltransferase involved in cell wall biosynthesis
MPVFNAADYLERALASVLEQTYPNLRLLVSDNASTDGTWELLQKSAAQDDRIVLHRQQHNIGVRPNFRFVLSRADTPFFMWHAHDDWLARTYLEELVRVLAENPDCALACASVVQVAQDGLPIRERVFPSLTARSRLGRTRVLLARPDPTRVYGLFRTDALRRVDALAEQFGYVWAADLVALLSLTVNDRIRGTDRTEIYYRLNGICGHSCRPDTPKQQSRFLASYAGVHVREFRAANLSLGEKLLCWPWLIQHFLKTTESFIKRPLKKRIKRSAKRLVSGSWLRGTH